jgi:hypothetical protein
MIDIHISCEADEIPAARELLAGMFVQADKRLDDEPTASDHRVPVKVVEVSDTVLPVGADVAVGVATPTKVKREKVALTDAQKAEILALHDKGMSDKDIKAKLNLPDGRQVHGVTWRGNHTADPEQVEMLPDDLTSKILKLKDIGCSNREIKDRLGEKNAKLIRATVKADVKKEIAAAISKDMPTSTMPLKTTRRILALADEKLTPSSISDALEEEFGLVVSEAEIMDVITMNDKGMIES